MHQPKIYIAGWGSISALGTTSQEMLKHLENATKTIHPLSRFSTTLGFVPLVGEVALSNQDLQQELSLSSIPSRTSLLACYAALEAVKEAKLTKEDMQNAAFISSTTVGGMDVSEQLYHRSKDSTVLQNVEHLCGASTQHVVDFLNIKGFYTTINTACSSAANAMMLGARMILQGKTDIAIVGGTDALCEFTLQGFHSLQLLSSEWCKPFDATRNGLNLGEGAAYIVLISEKLNEKYGAKMQLAGWANANDAHHQTASSPDGIGATLAMNQALQMAAIPAHKIDYINAHGTATPNNDASEIAAMKNVFSEIPPFSSTKAFTGHTLAAAGAVEAVISLLALEHQIAFANLNCFTNEVNQMPLTKTKYLPIEYAMSNSFGFGGNCASLIFRKV